MSPAEKIFIKDFNDLVNVENPNNMTVLGKKFFGEEHEEQARAQQQADYTVWFILASILAVLALSLLIFCCKAR